MGCLNPEKGPTHWSPGKKKKGGKKKERENNLPISGKGGNEIENSAEKKGGKKVNFLETMKGKGKKRGPAKLLICARGVVDVLKRKFENTGGKGGEEISLENKRGSMFILGGSSYVRRGAEDTAWITMVAFN